MQVALITGGSRGFGFALARELVARDWRVIIDARDAVALERARSALGDRVEAIPGDVSDADHRRDLVSAADVYDGLDLLVNNASLLGPTPLPGLNRFPLEDLREIFDVNAIAPLALTQPLLPNLEAAAGAIVNVSSDAAVEPYEGWGGYGASKAALDQISAVLGAELKNVRVYAFDPGDMRTKMHQDAYPGEDISDRPLPEEIVPSLMRLLEEAPPSGRYKASELTRAPAGVSS